MSLAVSEYNVCVCLCVAAESGAEAEPEGDHDPEVSAEHPRAHHQCGGQAAGGGKSLNTRM